MANPENLIPNSERTPSELREQTRKAGIASGKARRKKASLMRCAQRVLEADITPGIKNQIETITGELDDENDTLFTAMAAVMVKEAIGGNVSAFRELKDLVRDMDNVFIDDETEEDELSKALREWGESL